MDLWSEIECETSLRGPTALACTSSADTLPAKPRMLRFVVGDGFPWSS